MKRRPLGAYIFMALTAAVLLFQFVPIIIIVFFSFNSSRSVTSFTGFSGMWYEKLFSNQELINAFLVSFQVAFLCGVITIILSVPLAIALVRLPKRESAVPDAIVGLVFTTPEVAMGVSLLLLFSSIGLQLSPTTIVLGHVTFSLSYSIFVIRSRLTSLSPDIEEAAEDLGANKFQVFLYVIFPQLIPAILVSFVLVFLLSFDDFVIAFFTTGVQDATLPVYIYGMLRRGVTPEVNAIGSLMVFAVIVVALVGFIVMRRRGATQNVLNVAAKITS